QRYESISTAGRVALAKKFLSQNLGQNTTCYAGDCLKEPCPLLSRGKPAGFCFAKPPEPVAGNPIIDRITAKSRDDHQSVEQRPSATQLPGDFQCCSTFVIHLIPADQDNRIKIVLVDTVIL